MPPAGGCARGHGGGCTAAHVGRGIHATSAQTGVRDGTAGESEDCLLVAWQVIEYLVLLAARTRKDYICLCREIPDSAATNRLLPELTRSCNFQYSITRRIY